jgi:hypothetical protein
MLPGFPELSTAVENGRYICRHGEIKLTFYTDRSAERDLKLIISLIDNAGASIPLVVAPYVAAFARLFDTQKLFYFIAPTSFTGQMPRDERLIADAENLTQFINSIEAEHNFAVQILPQWQQLRPAIEQATREVLTRAAIRLKTIRHFARLWPINFRLNLPLLQTMPDISSLQAAPDVLALAGPSLSALPRIASQACVWCADTALPVLLHYGIPPAVIFSLDAGFASQEHFCTARDFIRSGSAALVADPLCSPPVLRLPFRQKFTYASSHPLVQKFRDAERPDLTPISNPEGNVGNLMLQILATLFPTARPLIVGHDRGHIKHITHARGTAYYRRCEATRHRLYAMETYALHLSRRYGAARSS